MKSHKRIIITLDNGKGQGAWGKSHGFDLAFSRAREEWRKAIGARRPRLAAIQCEDQHGSVVLFKGKFPGWKALEDLGATT